MCVCVCFLRASASKSVCIVTSRSGVLRRADSEKGFEYTQIPAVCHAGFSTIVTHVARELYANRMHFMNAFDWHLCMPDLCINFMTTLSQIGVWLLR